MVKGLVWAAILGSILVAMFYGMKVMNADSGELVGLAMAEPENGQVQLQVLIPLLMPKLDPPGLTASGEEDWDGWMTSHFDLRDASGNQLTWRKIGLKTKEIREHQAGTAEFIMGTELIEGQAYSLQMTPILSEPRKYVHRFTAAAQPFKRLNFEPNY